jgi:chromosomal replication initiator protein
VTPPRSLSAASGAPLPHDGDGARVPERGSPANEAWSTLQSAIRARIQPEQFETWFRRALLIHVDGELVRIAVQNTFTRDWLVSYYRGVLEQAVAQTFGAPLRVEFVIDPELIVRSQREASDAALAAQLASSQSSNPSRDASLSLGSSLLDSPLLGSSLRASSPRALSDGSDTQLAGMDLAEAGRSHSARSRAAAGQGAAARSAASHGQGSGHGSLQIEAPSGLLWSSDVNLNPKYTFDNFVVGPCNRFAHAAAVGVGEAPGKAYNPFFLHGNVGLGKTHLLQSLCFALLERNPRTRILYLSCETFVNHFINALENGDLAKFRNKYRNVDLLVVDDIHLLANKDRTQEEFFHTFNTLYQSGKQIVLSSDSPPKDIPTLQERLVSRFKWGLVTEIEPPCYETRMAILKRKSRERGREIPDEVARLLAERVESNIRELEGAVVKLIGYSSLAGAPISVDLAREALRDLFEKRKGQPSMEEILAIVTEHFGVKLSELQSKRRTNAIALPRQIAMYLARQITRHSLEEIGGFFGGRDHSTVIYAVDKVAALIQEDEASRQLVDGFMQRLMGPAN